MKMITIIIVVIVVVIVIGFFIFTLSNKQTAEKGNVEIIAPNTAKTNDPILIEVVLSAKKSAAPIDPLFSNILLYYKLTTEGNYQVAKPFRAELSEKYCNLQNDMDYIQYNYFLPLYPVGTRGEIEYYVDVMFEGKLIHTEGPQNIVLFD